MSLVSKLNWRTAVAEDKKVKIALDFDGVLHSYGPAGWTGPVPTGEPVPQAREFVLWLLSKGYELAIFSARANHPMGKAAIEEWLIQWGFPAIEISLEKPHADLYLDDRGFRFEGSFAPVIDFLNRNPKPGRWGNGGSGSNS